MIRSHQKTVAAPRILRGYGQVDFKNALSISFAEAFRSRAAHISTVIWGLAFGLMSARWAPPSEHIWIMIASLLIAAGISYSAMFPWRLRLLSHRWSLTARIVANGTLGLVLGVSIFFTAIMSVNVLSKGMTSLRLPDIYSVFVYSLYGFQYPLIGFYITLGMDLTHRQNIQLKENERFERLAEQARLVALRSQINPHFFFNALNTIAALIPSRPGDAERAVELLATALRPVLTREQHMLATLRKELIVAQAYTAIEELRLGGRCQFQYEADENAKTAMMPSLSLQPIMENAVRYGAALHEGEYIISLKARYENDILYLQVRNSPVGVFSEELNGKLLLLPDGHALDNINQRLQILFGNKSKLNVMKFPEGGGLCEVMIPQKSIRFIQNLNGPVSERVI